MTAHLALLWTYEADAEPAVAGKIQARCACGWVTPIKPDRPAVRAVFGRDAARHTAPATVEPRRKAA